MGEQNGGEDVNTALNLNSKSDFRYMFRMPLFVFIFNHLHNFAWSIENFILPKKEDDKTDIQNKKDDIEYENAIKRYNENTNSEPDIDKIQNLYTLRVREGTHGGARQSNGETLNVIIPTRFDKVAKNSGFNYNIDKAIESVYNQTFSGSIHIKFILGVDADAVIPDSFANQSDLVIARSSGKSQILALNAAHGFVDPRANYISFLEDDDWWEPEFLEWGMLALEYYDFVSSNQLNVDENGRVITISDFPTPSGWLMPLQTYMSVGPVNTQCKWHWDNEWLGRLSTKNMKRCHLVEKTAPTSLSTSDYRIGLQNLLNFGGPSIEIQRHIFDKPLVNKLSHTRSGTSKVMTNKQAFLESQREHEWIRELYGRTPW